MPPPSGLFDTPPPFFLRNPEDRLAPVHHDGLPDFEPGDGVELEEVTDLPQFFVRLAVKSHTHHPVSLGMNDKEIFPCRIDFYIELFHN